VRNTLDPRHPGTRIAPGPVGAAGAGVGAGAAAGARGSGVALSGGGGGDCGSSGGAPSPLSAVAEAAAAASAAAGGGGGNAPSLAAARLGRSPYSRLASNGGRLPPRAPAAAAVLRQALGGAAAASFGGSGGGRVQTVTKTPLKVYEAKNAPLKDLLDRELLGALRISREEAALVVLVGLQVMRVASIEARVTAELRAAGIPVYVPRYVNGSENSFSVVVPASQRNAAVALLHRVFVLGAGGAAEGGSAEAAAGAGAGGVPLRDSDVPKGAFAFGVGGAGATERRDGGGGLEALR